MSTISEIRERFEKVKECEETARKSLYDTRLCIDKLLPQLERIYKKVVGETVRADYKATREELRSLFANMNNIWEFYISTFFYKNEDVVLSGSVIINKKFLSENEDGLPFFDCNDITLCLNLDDLYTDTGNGDERKDYVARLFSFLKPAIAATSSYILEYNELELELGQCNNDDFAEGDKLLVEQFNKSRNMVQKLQDFMKKCDRLNELLNLDKKENGDKLNECLNSDKSKNKKFYW